MFLKLQLSNQFIRTRHETMKSFTAQGSWWQTVKAFLFFTAFMARKTFDLRSTLKRNIYPENECREKLLWATQQVICHLGPFLLHLSGIHCGVPGGLFRRNLMPPLIRINHFINEHWFFRGCFLFTFMQVFNFFCFKLHFRKLKDSSEKKLITCQTKSYSDSLFAFKHQNKWCHFQKVSNTGGFRSMSLTFATFCFWAVFCLLLLDISILALQNKCVPTTVFWPWCQRANMGVIYITLCLVQRLLGTSGSFRT